MLYAGKEYPSVHSVYEIETPENVRFHVELSGLASRALALVLDLVVMTLLVQGAAFVLIPLQWVSDSMVTALIIVLGFGVQWWYGALCEYFFSGRTCGKWLVGIATRDQRGLRLSLFQCTVRNLLRIVDLLPGLYLVGGLCAFIDPLGRRLGDLAAGTVVVVERRSPIALSRANSTQQPLSAYESTLHAVAHRLAPQERTATIALCASRDTLPLALRLALFERLAAHLEKRFGFTRPHLLSAENVVMSVRSGLYEPRTPFQES